MNIVNNSRRFKSNMGRLTSFLLLKAARHNLLFVWIIFLTVSCGNDSNLNQALKYAGDNRSELETVLNHYSNDPEKLAAARFLIENMPAHYSYRNHDAITRYYGLAESVLASGMTKEEQRDSLLNFCDREMPNLDKHSISDVKIITSEFLIHNIDQAFDKWKNCPWAAHLSFDEFCEWILPYKVVEYQELDNWRDTLQAYFAEDIKHMIPDDVEYNTCFKTLDFVRNEILREIKPYGMYTRAGYPILKASLLPKQTFGRCADYVNLGVMTYRSVGLPAVIDEAPFWGRYRAGHTWYTILGDRGQELPSEWDITSVPGWQFFPFERMPKVYRSTYAVNYDRLKYKKNSKYKYPFSICWADVTDKYMKPADIELPIMKKSFSGKKIRLKEPYAYICVFNGHATDWSIVDFGTVKEGVAKFHKIGKNILYIVMGYNGRALVPITEPFIVNQNGSIRYIHVDDSNLRTIDIRRKYFQSTNVVDKRRRILGAQIQYADKKDFSDAVTVFKVDTVWLPDKISINSDSPHRYWRYLSADGTYGSIAELGFFSSDTVSIIGVPIGVPNSTKDILNKAFDNNSLTNFETESNNLPNGAWVGLDFVEPKSVKFVRVVPRGDENDILPGDEYELKYWSSDNNWISLGIRIADDNSLHYDSIPSGALLWLSDHTRGWDERPFLIDETGNVEWW